MAQSKCLSNVFSYESWVHAVSGATGGVVAMSVFYPLDTVRLRLQLEDPERRKAQSTFKEVLRILKNEGVPSLYRGLVPVLESLCISNFVYFYTFHSLKAIHGGAKNQNALKDLLLGSIAGIINVLTTTPFWVVNTRLKMKNVRGYEAVDSTSAYNSLISGLIHIGKTEGIQGLWAGTIPSLMLVINPALQFMMYEMLKRKLTEAYGDLPPSMAYFAIGALAKAFATVLTYPLQLVQTKQRHGSSKNTKGDNSHSNSNDNKIGTVKMMLEILRVQGCFGLFRGLEAKILQTVLTAALMFATYEKIAKYVAMILIKKPKIVSSPH